MLLYFCTYLKTTVSIFNDKKMKFKVLKPFPHVYFTENMSNLGKQSI